MSELKLRWVVKDKEWDLLKVGNNPETICELYHKGKRNIALFFIGYMQDVNGSQYSQVKAKAESEVREWFRKALEG